MLLLGFVSCVSCAPQDLGEASGHVPRDSLVLQWTFVPEHGRQFSSAQSIDECEFVFADRETGDLIFASIGQRVTTRTVIRSGGPPLRGAQVDVMARQMVSVSFPSESAYAEVALPASSYEALKLPSHPWGGDWLATPFPQKTV